MTSNNGQASDCLFDEEGKLKPVTKAEQLLASLNDDWARLHGNMVTECQHLETDLSQARAALELALTVIERFVEVYGPTHLTEKALIARDAVRKALGEDKK